MTKISSILWGGGLDKGGAQTKGNTVNKIDKIVKIFQKKLSINFDLVNTINILRDNMLNQYSPISFKSNSSICDKILQLPFNHI